MRRRHAAAGALCALLALPAPTSAADAADAVAIGGDVRQPLVVDAAALRAMPAVAQVNYRNERQVDGQPQSASVVRGVRLIALLERAGLAARDRFD